MKVLSQPLKPYSRYSELEIGDVFATVLSPDVHWMKTDKGQVGLKAGLHFSGWPADTEVIRYPNACLNLGEPE